MTEFGRTLYSLMLDKGIEYRRDLADLLTDAGYQISPQTISNYMLGKRAIDPDFPLFVAEVLNLDEETQLRLARAYAFGQTKLTQENVERIKAFRERLRFLRGDGNEGGAGTTEDRNF